jgi:hypothetical protein
MSQVVVVLEVVNIFVFSFTAEEIFVAILFTHTCHLNNTSGKPIEIQLRMIVFVSSFLIPFISFLYTFRTIMSLLFSSLPTESNTV